MWGNYICRFGDEIVRAHNDCGKGEHFGHVHGYGGAP